jgi:hypothetical protein
VGLKPGTHKPKRYRLRVLSPGRRPAMRWVARPVAVPSWRSCGHGHGCVEGLAGAAALLRPRSAMALRWCAHGMVCTLADGRIPRAMADAPI